jgi:16S rRNA (adenine1518-N6/adenine1519-N6)-dimethyltransferase
MIRAKKRFGQHFLEPVWAAKVLSAIAPGASETFLEIGPGLGALTHSLAAAASRVVAFEIDRDLATRLESSRAEERRSNLTIVRSDFLEVTADQIQSLLPNEHLMLRVAGNLPYNIAAPILFKLTELYRSHIALRDATVMLQREVADRLLASRGTREYGVLTLLIGRHAGIERLLNLPPGAFRPIPKVSSTVVRLSFRPPVKPATSEAVVEQLTKSIFTRRRKTLSNALLAFKAPAPMSPAALLSRVGIDGRRRPETLTMDEIVALADCYAGPG